VSKDSQCGITDLQFFESTTSAQAGWESAGYKVVNYNTTTKIAFTKDYDSLPITQTKLEAETCMKPNEHSLSYNQNLVVYPSEITDNCSYEQNTKLVLDPRYSKNGLNTNQY
jgi:hypothetical protein